MLDLVQPQKILLVAAVAGSDVKLKHALTPSAALAAWVRRSSFVMSFGAQKTTVAVGVYEVDGCLYSKPPHIARTIWIRQQRPTFPFYVAVSSHAGATVQQTNGPSK